MLSSPGLCISSVTSTTSIYNILLCTCYDRSKELQRFVVLMQAGVDVVKIKASALSFTRHLARTLFLDPRAQDLCWLPPGR